jgi:hypothetical protein
MKESVVEIPVGSGNRYRYVYEDGETRYLGPVGTAPQISEKDFLRNVALITGPLEGTVMDEDYLVRVIEANIGDREPTMNMLSKEFGVPGPDLPRIRDRLKVRRRLAGNIIRFKRGIGYEWELYGLDDKLVDKGVTISWKKAMEHIKESREKKMMPEKNINVDRLIYNFDKNIDRVPGGAADYFSPVDPSFEQQQVERGILVELEHTNDPEIAVEIALDHLVEDRDYYTKLETIDPHIKRL